MGLEATKKSLDLDPEFFDAMAYYNLLFREKAKLATTFEEADRYEQGSRHLAQEGARAS